MYLEEKDAGKAGLGARGFKKKIAIGENAEQTEKRLTITTMGK